MIVFVVRLFAVSGALATAGMGAVILMSYLRQKAAPRRKHVILLALSYEGWVIFAVCHIVKSSATGVPWEWYASPLALVCSILGSAGLFRFIEKHRAEPRPLDKAAP